jgi:hypothetical protein
VFNLAHSWRQLCPLACAPLIRRPSQPTLKNRLGSCTATDKHRGRCRKTPRRPRGIGESLSMSKTKKAVRWPLSEAGICRLRLEFLDEGRDRLLQRSRFLRVAPVGPEFPPFSSSSSSVLSISVWKAAEAALGKGQPPILAAATRNTERRRMRAPQLGLQRPSTRSGCCSSKRGQWCRLPTPPGGAREGAGGRGDRL